MNKALRPVFLSVVLLFLLSPIVVVGGVSLNEKKALYFPPQGFSLAWYVELFKPCCFGYDPDGTPPGSGR